MTVQPLLGRFIIIWRHMKQPIHPDFLTLLRHPDSMGRIIAASPGNHRNSSVNLLHRKLHKLQMLIIIQRGIFPRCPGYHHSIRPAVRLPVKKLFEHRIINLPIFLHRRNNRRPHSPENHFLHIRSHPRAAPGPLPLF